MTKAKPKLVEGIELHPPKKAIDHPVVTLEWCVNREITDLMRAHPNHQWAMLIVAQERLEVGSDGLLGFSKGAREERVLIEGIRRIGDGRTPFTFRAPVNYDVVCFLVRSKGTSKDAIQGFWKRLRSVSKRSNSEYESYENLSSVVEGDRPHPDVFSTSDYVVPIAADNIIVKVPGGIFAKPSPRRQAFVRAYGFDVGDDECGLRGRLAICIFFLPVFLAIQLLWRGHLLISALVHVLVGGNPKDVFASAFTSKQYWPTAGGFLANQRFDPMDYVHGDSGKWYRAPGVIAFVLGYLWALLFGGTTYFLGSSLQLLAIGIPLFFLMIAGISFLLRITGNGIAPFIEEFVKSREPARIEHEIQRVEEYALCGTERPEGPRTFSLIFSGAKNMVCRPNMK